MTTPRDLLIVTLDVAGRRPIESGELSLALAGAELIDLLQSPTIRLDGGRIVPGHLPGPADPLLEVAAAALVMEEPHESVSDWLWRRGRSLAGTYVTVLESEGLIAREGRTRFREGWRVAVDSSSRRRAADRWASADPVLVTLADFLGIHNEDAAGAGGVSNYAVQTVLAAVADALLELGWERQRRAIEQAGFDNIWRGPE
ncbi:GPP34 family phosphoprotein [Streptomyces sp. NPDC006173]|uniref:GOLPH3/VPS74 family protein n=1 Tax=Streptomyces sp. NPDC006173 TaxID=3155349 RepID=UPI0033D18281